MNLQQHFTLTALVRHFAVAKLHEAKDNTIELHTKFINHCAALGTTFSILSICEHLRVLAFEHHVQSAGMLFFTLFRSVLLHFDLLDSVPCRQLAGMEPN